MVEVREAAEDKKKQLEEHTEGADTALGKAEEEEEEEEEEEKQ